ncbi:MAG: trypsin-like peptidase domain-containing protein [Pseudomonadota bacterium]
MKLNPNQKSQSTFTFFRLFVVLITLVSFKAAADNHNPILNAIVNIEFNKVVPWDDGYNSSGFGTGFVIDANQGIILTNKHIVNVGPIVAFAEFSNKRKLPLTPIYRDPVHDFGMFKYDPTLIKDLDIKQIELDINATVGDAITLYGNDGGEALSIIEGVLSRLDRPSPNYNSTNNDYNTFYMQAALGTSGGSSGSPILNKNGKAIAINAGGRFDTAAAFFLPMKIMYPVIQNVLQGNPVKRGTFEVVFEHIPFNQMDKFGKDAAQINSLRSSNGEATGRLLIEHIVKQSDADQYLRLGDFLLSVDSIDIFDFYDLETVLNQAVNESVSVEINRNGEIKTFSLKVIDLFNLVPNEYVEFGKAIFTPIGLSLARLFNVPSDGVLITSDGRIFGGQGIRNYARVDSINDQPIDNIDMLETLLSNIALNQKVSVRYKHVYNQQNQQFVKIRNLAQYFINRRCSSSLGDKFWKCTNIDISMQFADKRKAVVRQKVTSPFVDLEVFRPIEVNIRGDVTMTGLGLVIDEKKGLILTDKSKIDSSLSQTNVYFDNGATVSAEVLAIHPFLNLVLLRADMKGIVFERNIIPDLKKIKVDNYTDGVLFGRSTHIDFNSDVAIGWPLVVDANTTFDSFDVTYLPSDFSFYVSEDKALIGVAPGYSEKFPYDMIIPSELVLDFIDKVTSGEEWIFELKDQLSYVSFAEAVELGLSAPYINQIERKIFVTQGAELENSGLRSGDILLTLDNKNLTRLNDLYLALSQEEHQLTVLRNGEIMEIVLRPKKSKFLNISEVMVWGGSIIHEMPILINTPEGTRTSCLRIGFRYFGAPMYSALGSDPVCILTVDDNPVSNAEELKQLLFNKTGGEFTKILTVRLDKNFQLAEYQVREENFYWPSVYYYREGRQWSFISNLDKS